MLLQTLELQILIIKRSINVNSYELDMTLQLSNA